MSDLWDSIANIADGLHPDRVNSIADQIRSANGPEGLDDVKRLLATNIGESLISDLKMAWVNASTTSSFEIASALRAASRTASLLKNSSSTQLVWTGPQTSIVPTRKTEQVMTELIDSASESLFLVSYVFYNIQRTTDAINRAIERGVSVKILLESSKDHGGTLDLDGLKSMRAKVPKASLFIWSKKSRSEIGLTASVHAKCIVADGRNAFVTSANLTSAAMERNMEVGIKLTGGSIPSQLHDHLEALHTEKIIETF